MHWITILLLALALPILAAVVLCCVALSWQRDYRGDDDDAADEEEGFAKDADDAPEETRP